MECKKNVMKAKKPFKFWLYRTLPDLVFALLVLAATGVMYIGPIYRWQDRRFPMRWDPSSKRWFGPVELSYKKEGFIVSILIAAPLVGIGVILGMCLVFIRTPDKQPREHGRDRAASRDLWDLTAALLGLLKGFAMVYVPASFSARFLRQEWNRSQFLKPFVAHVVRND